MNGFPKTHIIGQDTVHFLEGQLDHPDKGFSLIFLKLTSLESFGLHFSESVLESIKGFGVVNLSIDTSSDRTEKLGEFMFLLFEVNGRFGDEKLSLLGH